MQPATAPGTTPSLLLRRSRGVMLQLGIYGIRRLKDKQMVQVR
jgi:hypothetical protein